MKLQRSVLLVLTKNLLANKQTLPFGVRSLFSKEKNLYES